MNADRPANRAGDGQALRRALAEYGLAPERAGPGGGTAGRAWRVRAGGREYFLRRRGVRTRSPERIAFDHGLRVHLAGAGFCATPPLETPGGATWVDVDGEVYELYPWVEGRPMGADIADGVRVPVARTLARLHRIASSYDRPCEPVVPQFTHFGAGIAPRPRFDDPKAVLEVIDHVAATWAGPDQREALARAAQRVRRLAEAYGPGLYDALPRYVIHGDYNCYNLLFGPDGGVAGVFDFDWAWREVRVHDIADAVFFFGTRRHWPDGIPDIWELTACPRFDLEPMRAVLRAYEAASPLAEAERRALPLAMLARWVSIRCEGVMKVPEPRRAAFLLMDFEAPFGFCDSEGEALVASD